MGLARILFLSDTHLGFDLPFRPRVERRRRGPDFFRNFERALEPARQGEVDCVIHGGDILYRSKVPPELVQMAFEPLKRLADKGMPIYVVPGNHERSSIPYELLAKHPNISLFDRPRTYRLQAGGLTIALAGLPSVRNGVRSAFPHLLEETGWRSVRADVRLLCLHQSVEGAVVGPADYVFRYDKDTIRASDIPHGFTAVLSGHIHRHQILRRDLKGEPLPAPVFYPGSIERTSFAEKKERKGYLTLAIETDRSRKARLQGYEFHELPTRPMVQLDLDAQRMGPDVESSLKKVLGRLPPDGVVSLKFHGRLTKKELEVLCAPSLRTIVPPTMNVNVKIPFSSKEPRKPGKPCSNSFSDKKLAKRGKEKSFPQ